MRIKITVLCLIVMCCFAFSSFAAGNKDFTVTDEGRKDDTVYYTVECSNGKTYTAFFKGKDVQNGQDICSDMTSVVAAMRLKDALKAMCQCSM